MQWPLPISDSQSDSIIVPRSSCHVLSDSQSDSIIVSWLSSHIWLQSDSIIVPITINKFRSGNNQIIPIFTHLNPSDYSSAFTLRTTEFRKSLVCDSIFQNTNNSQYSLEGLKGSVSRSSALYLSASEIVLRLGCCLPPIIYHIESWVNIMFGRRYLLLLVLGNQLHWSHQASWHLARFSTISLRCTACTCWCTGPWNGE